MTVSSEHIGWSRPFAHALSAAVPRADIVHVHAIWNFPTWSAMREAHRSRVPYVVAPQGSLESWALGRSRYLKAAYAALAEKPYFDKAASMQALTETEARQCRDFGIRAPIRILPNGVDLGAIDRAAGESNLRSELDLPHDSTLLLFLGRLFPKKGLDLLVRAFSHLAGQYDNAYLLIAGTDAGTGYGSAVARLVSEVGVGRNVRLLGEVMGERKFQVIRAADAFVLTSYSEGLPVAVLEAMACRRPVVITAGCNLPIVATAEAGWLVDATVDGVLDGLRNVMASVNERWRRGDNARALIEDQYTWDRIARESISLYQSHRLH